MNIKSPKVQDRTRYISISKQLIDNQVNIQIHHQNKDKNVAVKSPRHIKKQGF